jgi:hypothetical protein
LNFACHPITTGPGNRLVSADFPGVACAAIEAAEGGVALFINGACGDINPVTASPFLDCRDGSFDTVKHNGLALAAAAMKLQDTLQPLAYEPLLAQSQWLNLPLMEAPAEPELRAAAVQQYADLAEPLRNADDCPWRQALAQLQWTMATLKEYQLGSLRKSLPVEIQVLTFFGVALVGIPGELFSALGQSLCYEGRAVQTLLATYTNGNIGYIAPREEYAEPGYEVGGAHIFYGYPAALAPGAGETMVATAQRLIDAAVPATF